MKKKILITDDHYIIRAGIAFLLESKMNYSCTTDFAESFTETKHKLSIEQYDLLILDIHMPDSIFKAMIKELKNIQENLKIMIFSAYDAQVAIQYINEGSDAYISKNASEPEILNAVNSIFDNGYYYPEQIIHKLLNHTPNNNTLEKLSRREFEIFKLLVEGNGNLEISNIMNIQMSTISTYKKNIFQKLKVRNIVDLVRIYDEIH